MKVNVSMEYIVFLILAPISFAITYVTILVTWKYRKELLGRILIIYFLSIQLHLVSNVLELISKQEQMMLFWTKVQISVYGLIPVYWLAFALVFSNNRKTAKDLLSLWKVLLIPVASAVLVFLYPLTDVFYTGHRVLNNIGLSTLRTEYNYFFWVYGAHCYILFIAGSFLTLRHLISTGILFQKLSFFIMVGSLFPLIANLMYILPLPVFVQKDFTPIALALSGLFFFIGIYWHRFLDIIPIARNIIVEEMDQGIIILD
ncbi:MAG: histidine kinase N-terminal 7TM domain-containing protein, partial [Spirochaetales bacterium]|nr:histidine kinase N-terminal 7TM domain-containing protein [Spirochaetales bacterium]